jgi:hypothetical protein
LAVVEDGGVVVVVVGGGDVVGGALDVGGNVDVVVGPGVVRGGAVGEGAVDTGAVDTGAVDAAVVTVPGAAEVVVAELAVIVTVPASSGWRKVASPAVPSSPEQPACTPTLRAASPPTRIWVHFIVFPSCCPLSVVDCVSGDNGVIPSFAPELRHVKSPAVLVAHTSHVTGSSAMPRTNDEWL